MQKYNDTKKEHKETITYAIKALIVIGIAFAIFAGSTIITSHFYEKHLPDGVISISEPKINNGDYE